MKDEKITYTGKCGKNVTYSFDEETSTLTISGEGEMFCYEWKARPWHNNNYNWVIKNLVIENGVTVIGAYAFMNQMDLESVKIGKSVKRIGIGAFCSCYNLCEVNLPRGLEYIAERAFYNCKRLPHLKIRKAHEKVHEHAFDGVPSMKRHWYRTFPMQHDRYVFVDESD